MQGATTPEPGFTFVVGGEKKKSNVWLNPGGGCVCIFAREGVGRRWRWWDVCVVGEAASGDQSEQRTQRA